jgi:hypothetical protein
MKAVLSLKPANRRRLLTLLRELRCIRRELLAVEQLLGKARETVVAAAEAGKFVRVALRTSPCVGAPCRLCVALDHGMLQEAERRVLQTAYVHRRSAMHVRGPGRYRGNTARRRLSAGRELPAPARQSRWLTGPLGQARSRRIVGEESECSI